MTLRSICQEIPIWTLSLLIDVSYPDIRLGCSLLGQSLSQYVPMMQKYHR